MREVIRIGTRGSELATTQSGHVRDALASLGQEAELVVIHTEGDHNRHDPVEKIGVGVFTQALRYALRQGKCDVVVHSFKDLPTVPEHDMVVAAVPQREDSREVLVSRGSVSLKDLPKGAVVGTSAPRRVSQLRALRSDLEIVPLRGNVDTRMGRVDEDLDAVILARAGLSRTGRLHRAAESLDPVKFMPAPAQGALAVECLSADEELVQLLRRIDHAPSHAQAIAERAVLNELNAGCTAPVAAHSTLDETNSTIELRAGVFAVDGSQQLVETVSGPMGDADSLGRKAARALIARGALEVMGDTQR